MHCQANSRLTPRARAEVFAAVEAGMTVSAACAAFRWSRRAYYRWLPRWLAAGSAGLIDRSSRPFHSPQRLSPRDEVLICGLRLVKGWGPDRIAAMRSLSRSSVHRAIRRLGPSRDAPAPISIVRYEYSTPGGLLHLDTKKLGRIGDGPGHRATGDRRGRKHGIGWEVLHVAIDDATRLVYAEILPDDNPNEVRQLLEVGPDTTAGRRDRAILLTLVLTGRRAEIGWLRVVTPLPQPPHPSHATG
jgi:leucine-zipper of insertion element IS481